MKEFNKTQEQVDIIEAVKSGESIKVVAQAGAAKTTTLVMASEEVVKPTLYLTFNKTMQEEARDKFPSWVEVRTTHSMAYGDVGHKYREKLKRPTGRYQNVCGTASEVARFFKIKPIEYEEGKWITSASIGYAIQTTLRNFECSDSEEISKEHVSREPLRAKGIKCKDLERTVTDIVLKNSKALWALRINLNSNILATHDTYLKLWQMSKPDLSNYDILMVDEFQDTNMCVVDVVKRQEGQVIIVGDPSQAIYQFRGAINALDKFEYRELPLSKSFRYGQSVAEIGSIITKREGMEGCDSISTRVVVSGEDHYLPDNYTAIYRTNSGMLLDAVKAIEDGKSINIVTDVRDFVSLIDSTLALKGGDKRGVRHTTLLVYESWKDLNKDIDYAPSELQRVVAMIKNKSVYKVLGLLRSHRNTNNPDITFVTAHKSKGLEYDNVVLGNDFPSIFDKEGMLRDMPIAETNLLYVASTRAKDFIKLNEQVEERINLSGGAVFTLNIKEYSRQALTPLEKLDKFVDEEVSEVWRGSGMEGVGQFMRPDNEDLDIDGNLINHLDKEV